MNKQLIESLESVLALTDRKQLAYKAIKEAITGLKVAEHEKTAAMLISMEFGYKQAEQGNNLDMAFINFNKTINNG